MATARTVRIRGRVQGVFFRVWTRNQAERAGVSGWVANCSDGSVEAWLEGDAEALDTLIDLMRRGPPGARVDSLDIEEAPVSGSSGFTVRH